MNDLTIRQREVLNWIKRFVEANGYAPTRTEIAEGMGFSSANAAEEHLQALQRKGTLRVVPGVARGIVLGSFNDTSRHLSR